jgi:hypothetical protein
MTDLAQENMDYFFSRLDLEKLVGEDRIFFMKSEDVNE